MKTRHLISLVLSAGVAVAWVCVSLGGRQQETTASTKGIEVSQSNGQSQSVEQTVEAAPSQSQEPEAGPSTVEVSKAHPEIAVDDPGAKVAAERDLAVAVWENALASVNTQRPIYQMLVKKLDAVDVKIAWYEQLLDAPVTTVRPRDALGILVREMQRPGVEAGRLAGNQAILADIERAMKDRQAIVDVYRISLESDAIRLLNDQERKLVDEFKLSSLTAGKEQASSSPK